MYIYIYIYYIYPVNAMTCHELPHLFRHFSRCSWLRRPQSSRKCSACSSLGRRRCPVESRATPWCPAHSDVSLPVLTTKNYGKSPLYGKSPCIVDYSGLVMGKPQENSRKTAGAWENPQENPLKMEVQPLVNI